MNSGQLREEIEKAETIAKEKREKLQKICKEVLVDKGYQRHAYGRNKTHCNRATEKIAQEMGYETDWMHYIDRSGSIGIVGTANHIYYEALKAEKRKEIFRVDEEKARELAWAGEVVILTAAAPPGKSGHVSVVYPNEKEIMVCNVGWWNLICNPHDRKSFGGGMHYLTTPLFFHLQKNS